MADPKATLESTVRVPSARPPALHPSDLPCGATVGRYVVLGTLGKGGMGSVWSAYDPQLDRRVALKFLRVPPHDEAAEPLRVRFLREAQAMARLSHPNVVAVYDVGLAEDGRVYIAMEMVEGGTLTQWLQEKKPRWRAILRVLCDAGEGLAAAHRAGFVHRDFKPDNVLMAEGEVPKVADFGLARASSWDAEAATAPMAAGRTPKVEDLGLARAASWDAGMAPTVRGEAASSPVATESAVRAVLASNAFEMPLTAVGAVLGTPGFMAPEQYGGERFVDARADVFAFCATAYRALYERAPFEGETLRDVADATQRGDIQPPPPGADVPGWVFRVLQRGMATDPGARFASMADVLAALRADPAKRRRRWGAVAAVGLALAGGLLALRAVHERRVLACRAMADPWRGVWDSSRKEAIAGAFVATGAPFARDAWAKVEHAVDVYADAWSRTMEVACTATRVRREESEATFELTTACLDERLDDVRALVEVLGGADGKTVLNAAKAAHDLPTVARCSDTDRLSAGARLPSDPKLRAEIRTLQGELAKVKALNEAGKWNVARERLEPLGARIAVTGYGPLRVAAAMLGASSIGKSDPKRGVADFEEAYALADGLRLDEPKFRCALGISVVDDEWLGRPDEARRWRRLAAAALERLGGDPSLQFELDLEEGFAATRVNLPTDRIEVAFKRMHDAGVEDPFLQAELYTAWSSLLQNEGRVQEGIEKERLAIASREAAFGAENPSVGLDYSNLAGDELRAGMPEDALAAASHATAMFDATLASGDASESDWLAWAEDQRGRALVRLGRATEGLPHFQRAHDLLVRTTGEETPYCLKVGLELAEAHRLAGETEAARALVDEVAALAPKATAADDSYELLPTMLLERAELEMARGGAAAARDLAERALSSFSAERSPEEFAVAETRLVLATALASLHGDTARVRELARQAREAFAKLRYQLGADRASALLAQGP